MPGRVKVVPVLTGEWLLRGQPRSALPRETVTFLAVREVPLAAAQW